MRRRANKNATCLIAKKDRKRKNDQKKQQQKRDDEFNNSLVNKKPKEPKEPKKVKTIKDIESTPVAPAPPKPKKKMTRIQNRQRFVNGVRRKHGKAPIKSKQPKKQGQGKEQKKPPNSRPIRVGKETPSGKWRCQICTFMNEEGAGVCSICTSQRGQTREQMK